MNHRTDSQACLAGCGAGHVGGTGPLLSLWEDGHSIHPFSLCLTSPSLQFIWGRGWRQKRQNRTPALDLAAPFQSCFSSAFFFFFFLPNWSFASYSLSLSRPSPASLLLPNAPTSLPVPRSLCLFISLSWLCCFNNVDSSLGSFFFKYIDEVVFKRTVKGCIFKSLSWWSL